MYKEKTGHRKEDKEGIPAQRKSNGTEEELLKPGKGKSVETKDANRLGTYWPIDGQALMLVMDYIQGMRFLLQGIFSTQESNLHLLHLLHWQVDSLPLHHLGSNNIYNLQEI